MSSSGNKGNPAKQCLRQHQSQWLLPLLLLGLVMHAAESAAAAAEAADVLVIGDNDGNHQEQQQRANGIVRASGGHGGRDAADDDASRSVADDVEKSTRNMNLNVNFQIDDMTDGSYARNIMKNGNSDRLPDEQNERRSHTFEENLSQLSIGDIPSYKHEIKHQTTNFAKSNQTKINNNNLQSFKTLEKPPFVTAEQQESLLQYFAKYYPILYSEIMARNATNASTSGTDKKISLQHATLRENNMKEHQQFERAKSQALAHANFEHYKKQRATLGRIGHRMHKKRYKDYLRHSRRILTTAKPSNSEKVNNRNAAEEPHVISIVDENDNLIKFVSNKNLPEMPTAVATSLKKQAPRNKPASPIFAITNYNEGYTTLRPFDEGQITYYAQTEDNEDDTETRLQKKQSQQCEGFKCIGPAMRNGLNIRNRHHGRHHRKSAHHRSFHHGKHTAKLLQQAALTLPSNTRQNDKNGNFEVAHQITDANELQHYYAKWPHLLDVEKPAHHEPTSNKQPELNSSQTEIVKKLNSDLHADLRANEEEQHLPPYIRKFYRRNKQLLNLLEGPMLSTSKSKGRNFNEYGIITHEQSPSARKRFESYDSDMFAQQRSGLSTAAYAAGPTSKTSTMAALPKNANGKNEIRASILADSVLNEIPHEKSSREDNQNFDDNGSGGGGETARLYATLKYSLEENEQLDNLSQTARTPLPTTSLPKTVLYKLPSYSNMASNSAKQQFRSSKFAHSSNSRFSGNSFYNSKNQTASHAAAIRQQQNDYNVFRNNEQLPYYSSSASSYTGQSAAYLPDVNKQPSVSSSGANTNAGNSRNRLLARPAKSFNAPSPLNTFAYHVESPDPANPTGSRKQRLPFVAIFDRRLKNIEKAQ